MLANPHVDLTRKIRILWRPELYSIQQKYHLPEYKQVSGAGESNLQFLLTSDTGFLFYSIPYSFRSFSWYSVSFVERSKSLYLLSANRYPFSRLIFCIPSSRPSLLNVFSCNFLLYVVKIISNTSARCFFKKSVNTSCLIQASYDSIFYIRLFQIIPVSSGRSN